jgi:thiol:disulfide interchange protein
MVVLFSALIGLAISTAHKYADAVVKTFAAATVAVNLVRLSSLYGLQQPSVVAWMGVLVVVTATAWYGRFPCRIPRESTASTQRADRDAGVV